MINEKEPGERTYELGLVLSQHVPPLYDDHVTAEHFSLPMQNPGHEAPVSAGRLVKSLPGMSVSDR
jgi:hypothetical protein